MATSNRVLTLLSVLQSPRDWGGQELADRLGVTVRTVRRDIDRLRELGYAIDAAKGPYGGYRLAAGSDLPPLLFDEEQAVAISVALQNAPAAGVDIDDAARRALATVRQVMPSHLRHRVEGIAFASRAAATKIAPSVLEAVSAAVRERRVLRFDYGESQSGPARRAEPHAVIARDGRWYVVAWDLGVAEWRILRLDRIHPRSAGGAPFAPRGIPTGDATTFVAARFKGSDAADAWPVTGELILPLPASAIAPWSDDAVLEELSDDACRVRVGSWSWAGVLAWATRFDCDFDIVGPPALAEAAMRAAQRLKDATAERDGIR